MHFTVVWVSSVVLLLPGTARYTRRSPVRLVAPSVLLSPEDLNCTTLDRTGTVHVLPVASGVHCTRSTAQGSAKYYSTRTLEPVPASSVLQYWHTPVQVYGNSELYTRSIPSRTRSMLLGVMCSFKCDMYTCTSLISMPIRILLK